MRFILGAPCAGKGTLSMYLKKMNSNFVFLSAGNILREMCQDVKYAHLKEILDGGGLVNTDLIGDILMEKAKSFNFDVFIDGFPRTIEQAIFIQNFMEKNNIKSQGIFCVSTNLENLIERTYKRQFCFICQNTYFEEVICCNEKMSRRKDDNIPTLMKRLKIYNQDIQEILNILCGPVFFLDNNGNIEQMLENITSFL